MTSSEQQLRASLAGAVDLSSLKNRPAQAETSNPASGTGTTEPGGSASNFEIANLVTELTTDNLRNFMAISNAVPVIVEFYTNRSESSVELSSKLARLVREAAGRLALARADADSSPDLVQAFDVKSLPSVHVLLMGRPVALFTADQPLDAIAEVLTKVLQAAAQNGMNGTVTVTESSENATAQEAPVSPKHAAAMAALNAGDLLLAEKEFALVLADSPADVIATEALAQIRLQLRLEGVDFEGVLASDPKNLAELLLKADCVLATGELDAAFDLILDRFAVHVAERDALRQRLLELFVAVGAGEAVSRARKRLTMLLY